MNIGTYSGRVASRPSPFTWGGGEGCFKSVCGLTLVSWHMLDHCFELAVVLIYLILIKLTNYNYTLIWQRIS